MAERAMSRNSPNVHDTFQGDLAIQKSTINRRAQIRDLVVALLNDIQLLSGDDVRVEVTADIKINIAQPRNKEHLYSVSVTSSSISHDNSDGSNGTSFPIAREHSDREASPKLSHLDSTDTRVPAKAGLTGVNEPLSGGSTDAAKAKVPDVRPSSSRSQPSKRPRTDSNIVDLAIPGQPPTKTQRADPTATPMVFHPDFDSTINDMKPFLEDWRKQWHSQGGYLYDQLTKITSEQARHYYVFDSRLNALQSIVPAANSQVLAGLTDITKNMIPWLEQCRKTDADSSQAREEKWRTSSATFHDQARKERSAAEKALLEELRAQKSILDEQTKMIKTLISRFPVLPASSWSGGASADES